ncbi:polysaccharide pyruvyl transferase family protein [Kaistella carnis]|uniref:polysaccharide pyruvyl transferase family protein n=1 Tax=Kaistella carnis TaxID=1241979 RepID=UPI002898A17C|nr:polysaccharide pyruvyl transferase family protein [Kaistella carnis]
MSIDKSKKQAYIFLAADYGNLGDVAITYAQTKFIEENSNFQVIEIPISKSLEGLHYIKRNIKGGDIVTTVGGGNMGDLYDQIEYIRQLVIRSFPKNKMISFPQTFDFGENEHGQKYLKKAQNIYNQHKNLVLIAREKTSYELMQQHFKNAKVLLTPDIVLSLDKSSNSEKRSGIVLCLRKDKEKILNEKQSIFIKDAVNSESREVSFYDTHINKSELSLTERVNALEDIWAAFRGAELVITDRLHGMIFCYITKTPCIVFQNNNHKVRETYGWIKDCEGIELIQEFNESHFLNVLRSRSNRAVKFVPNANKYDVLIKELQ